MFELAVTAAPSAEELEVIGKGLAAFNESSVGPAERQALAVVVRDAAGTIVGGMSGYTAWGWLYTQWLWVDEAARGQKLAGRILAVAESEALKRGCFGAHIDSFSAHALHVYQQAGYEVFGELADFPKGKSRWFLKKMIADVL